MTRVLVPVRYPLSNHSKRTLSAAVDLAAERDAALTVLHVNLYQDGGSVTRSDLKAAAERAVDVDVDTRYVVRKGFLVEETILDEAAAEAADVVVIGTKQAGRWRRMLRRLFDDPDVDAYLREHLDCEVVTVSHADA
ncbi:universal stress protein [Halorubellus sp. JP-L1]|uniref:universal stress protein n=1 Tax=Halorubellus sp. JP-L1 TaxID=2715753 RepID=UPI00140C692F|nr:universal stress protein [Halorubellus sp. JP-L1]NHN40637.1 universal stress protein [Halorubellus sp. JP-L1]